MEGKSLARYEFRRRMEELQEVGGKATELISLYVPPTRQVSDAMSYLRNEYSQSSNIKSKSTRKNVMSAIESIMGRLRHLKTVPENGIVFFVGHKVTGNDQTDMVQFAIEPPEPISIFLYRCDSQFFLDPLLDMMEEKETFGLIVIDRSEATIGLLKGHRIIPVKNIPSRVPSKHGRGGQSQRRFERLIEIAAHEFFKKAGELANEVFLEVEDLRGILVGGPGATKDFFVEKGYLHHELGPKVIDVFDVGYTDESGLRELVDKASDSLTDIDLMVEKKMVQRFMREVVKEHGKFAYGVANVLNTLVMGATEVVLVSEGLRVDLYEGRCGKCGHETRSNAPVATCLSCGAPVAVAKGDLVRRIAELADQSGAEVHLISPESEEGSSFLRTFGGVAAILRFRVDPGTAA
ncbi:MAG: peptide chain release factor aRF-1 [Thermoplasmata archaeon]|nr:peptide chain release factor aRF-1 [Thermoplasmata archaeon]